MHIANLFCKFVSQICKLDIMTELLIKRRSIEIPKRTVIGMYSDIYFPAMRTHKFIGLCIGISLWKLIILHLQESKRQESEYILLTGIRFGKIYLR